MIVLRATRPTIRRIIIAVVLVTFVGSGIAAAASQLTVGGTSVSRRTTTRQQDRTASDEQAGRRPPGGYMGLQFPSKEVREYTISLHEDLAAKATGLWSSYGFRFMDGARVRDAVQGEGEVVRVNERGDTVVRFDNGSTGVFAAGGSLLPVEGETRFLLEGPPDGDPVSMTTVMGLILIRDIYVAQMNAFADYLDSLAEGSREERIALAESLGSAALEAKSTRGIMNSRKETAEAVRQQAPWNGSSERRRYESAMREADELEQSGDLARAEELRSWAREDNEWGQYLQFRDDYLGLLDQNPLLGLRHGTFTVPGDEPRYLFEILGAREAVTSAIGWERFVETYGSLPGVIAVEPAVSDEGHSFIRIRVDEATTELREQIPERWNLMPVVVDDSGHADSPDYVVLTDYLRASAAEARRLAEEASEYDTLDDLWQFGTPAYTRQHQSGYALARSTRSELPALLVEEAVWVVSGATLAENLEDATTEVTLAGLAALSLLIPVAGPFIAAGLGVVQLFRDGSDLYAVYGETDEAASRGAVTGFSHVATLEDEAEAAETKTFVSAFGLVLDVGDAVFQGVRVLRATSTMTPDAMDVPVGFVRRNDGTFAPLSDTDFFIPNGVAARVSVLDESASTAVLAKIDTEHLALYSRAGTPGDLDFFTDAGLAPQLAVESGGRRYFLSRPFRYMPGTVNERVAVVAFQETPAGTVIPRTFYLSNEHGVWRAATGMGDKITKGPRVLVDDVTQRPLTAQEIEERVAVGGMAFPNANEVSADLAAELQGPLARWLSANEVLDLPANQAGRAFEGHLEAAGAFTDPREFAEWVNAPDVQLPLSPGGGVPDLSAGPLDQWAVTSPLYGEVEGFLYPSQDGSSLFVVLRDTRGNVWVPGIQDAEAGLTPFGTRWSVYEQEGLNRTPLVHEGQGSSAAAPSADVPPQFRDEYHYDPNYRNGLNRALANSLPAPGQAGGLGHVGYVDDVQSPAFRRERPGTDLADAASDAATAAMRTGSAGANLTDATIEANEVPSAAARLADAVTGANEMRRKEIESWLAQNNLPTTVAELDEILGSVPEDLRGENFEQIRRLRSQLAALQSAAVDSDARATGTTDPRATDPGETQPRATEPGATNPADPDEAPASGATTRTGAAGSGNEIIIGTDPSSSRIPALYFEFRPVDDEEREDDDFSGTDTRDPETALDVTAGNPISLNPFDFGDAVDLTFQSMTIELEFDGGSVTLPPGERHELTLRSGAGRRMPPRLQDPMASARRLLFTGPTWTTRAVSAAAPAALPGGAVWVAARHVSSSSGPGRPTASATPPAGRQQGGAVQMFLTSLGNSSGEAFTAQIFNTGSSPVTLAGGPLVVEPLKEEVQERVREQLDRLGDLEPLQMNFDAYCLEYLKLPPMPNQVFQIADQQLQQRFAPVRDILSSSRRLFDAGRLTADIAPQDYFHSIRQWAIWTEEQGFDRASFVDAFIDHTRKNLEAQGQQWNPAFGDTLRGALGGRWNDIQMILSEGGR